MSTEFAVQVLRADLGDTAAERLILIGIAMDSDLDGMCRNMRLELIAHRAEVSVEEAVSLIREMVKRGLIVDVAGGIRVTLPV